MIGVRRDQKRKKYNCRRKEWHKSKPHARRKAKEVREATGEMLIFYACYCNRPPHWHLGHPPKPRRKQN